MEAIKGFSDYVGPEAQKRAAVRKVFETACKQYGFFVAETPLLEAEEFVKRKGEAGSEDEAVSDVYTLQDKGKRKLALRYEFTFQLERLMQNQKLPFKRYQIGEVFRDEPVKGNRTRQFTTCDADVVGSNMEEEAEVLALVATIMERLGIKGMIQVNNRKLLNDILEEYGVKAKDRDQVMRELDKLDKLPQGEVKANLKKYGAEKILDLAGKPASYFKKYSAYTELADLVKRTKLYGVKLTFAPFLARGLSYYTGTIFEVKTKAMRETVFGGGAYTFNDIPCFGFGASIERLSAVSPLSVSTDQYLLVSLGEDKETIALAQNMRKVGKNVSLYYGKPSKALSYANSYGITNVVFIGAKEVQQKTYQVKNMDTGKSVQIKRLQLIK